MKAKIIPIGTPNMSGQALVPETGGAVPALVPKGSRARTLSVDEVEYTELLFSLFQKHLLGTRANGKETVTVAMGAIRAFARYVGLPPWMWTEIDLSEFLAHKVSEDDIGLGRQATYITYLRGFQNYVLDSVGLKNDIHRRFGVQPQRFVTQENAVAIKRKRHELKRAMKPLTAQQCTGLINTFDQQIMLAEQAGSKSLHPLRRDKAMVMLVLLTGIRVEELVTISVNDFMSDEAHPQFGSYALLSVLGKGRKRRIVRLFNPIIKDVMDWYMQEVRPGFLRVDTDDPQLLFFSERGSRLCTEQVRRMLRDLGALAGIPFRVRPHLLRHTYATQMKSIIGPEALQRQLGHEYLSTTLGTYYHADPEMVGNEIEQGIVNLTKAIEPLIKEFTDENHP